MFKFVALLISFLVVSGCATNTQKVDAYVDLLGPNTAIVDSPQSVTFAQLRNARVGLVTGANFENYVAQWEREREKGPSFGYPGGAQGYAEDMDKNSPTVAARQVLAALAPMGSRIEVYDDFNQATAAGVDWIIVFDLWPRYAGGFIPTFETRAGLHLLTPNLARVIKVEIDNTDQMHNNGISSADQYNAIKAKAISKAATTFLGSLKN